MVSLNEVKTNIYQQIKFRILSENDLILEENKKENKAFILGVPNHGNLGDQAIVYAEKKYIKSVLPSYQIIEVPSGKLHAYSRHIKGNLQKNDILFYHGGGNMGTLYPSEEKIRRFAINYFKNNKFISFPQSIFFENSPYGREELKKVQKCYSNNKNFILTAREKNTKEIMEKVFKDKESILTPDIVFHLSSEEFNSHNRCGVLTTLRNDKEKSLNKKVQDKLIRSLEKEFEKVTITDTHVGNAHIDSLNREDYLSEIWNQYTNAEVVVTDRLHGMIFSYITKTPCIVFKNNNPKIESTYNTWLTDCNFIEMMEDGISIDKVIERIKVRAKINPDNHSLKSKFNALENTIISN